VAAAETRSIAAPVAAKFDDSQSLRETTREDLREFYVVKVGSDGEEGEPQRLPDDALSNLGGLFENFRKQQLPNGTYRVYLREPGFPTRKLIEFYKSGNSFGDPVREPGRGSNPIPGVEHRTFIPPKQETMKALVTKQRSEHQDMGRDAAALVPAAAATRPTSGGDASPEKMDQTALPVRPGHDTHPIDDKQTRSPGRWAHPLAGAAMLALSSVPSHLRRQRWDRIADKAMENSETGSFGLVARLRRRLRREK